MLTDDETWTNAFAVEEVTCNLCGSATGDLIHEGEDRLLGHPGRFRLVQCPRCGLIRQNPRPVDMAPFYEGDYVPFRYRPRRRLLRWRESPIDAVTVGTGGAYYQLLLEATPRRSGRLLDVGCATGDFLVVAHTAGWQVAGCDPSAAAVEQARKRLGAAAGNSVYVGMLEQVDFPDEAFDVVTLGHTIEHVPDPVATLREVRRVLRPDGVIIIQTPAWLSLESRLWGRYWAGFDCPRHLYVFSPRTLRGVLEQAGCRIDRYLHHTSYYMWGISLLFLLHDRLSQKQLARIYHVYNGRLLRRYFAPFFKVIDAVGLGSQLTLTARKL